MKKDFIGHFACSCSGHDAGTWYVVIAEEDGRLIVADGRLRTVERPKKKNPLHLQVAGAAVSQETLDLLAGKKGGADEAIRHEIGQYRPLL